MKMLKNYLRFYKNIPILFMHVLIMVVFALLYIYIPVSEFSDATWVYSASMQTLATLIALLPISYGYYIANIDNEKNEEFDSYVMERLKKDVYYDMMTVIFTSIFTILLNLIGFFLHDQGLLTFLITFLTTISIGQMSIYIYRLFDPNKVKEILKEYDVVKVVPGQKVISLDQFITDYLELESQVKDLITNENDNELLSNTPLYDIVDLYSKDYPQLAEYYDVFKEIIFHRNNIIHNYSEIQVDYSKYLKLLDLTKQFKKVKTEFIHKNIFKNTLTIKTTIEKCLEEYQYNPETNQLIEDDVTSLLHSYFISDYYDAVSDEPNMDVDFEIRQNNYSKHKLLAIDIRSSNTKNVHNIAKSFFKRFIDRYTYLFIIFYLDKTKEFIVYYQTKDGQLKKFNTVVKEVQ